MWWQQKYILLHIGAVLLISIVISWMNLRPFGLIFGSTLAFWLYKTRCPAVYRLMTSEQFNTKLKYTCNQFIELRKDKPGLFCTIVSAGLLALAILGHIVSGSCIVIFGLMVATLISVRHKFKIITTNKEDENIWSSQTTENDMAEFLPDVNETNLMVLQRAGEEAIVPTTPGFSLSQIEFLNINQPNNTNNNSSNIYNEDTILPDEYNDNKQIEDEIPDDLLITDSLPEINGDSSSDDDNEDDFLIKKHPCNINFKNKHFNGDELPSSSSTSDDDSIVKGLCFKDYHGTDGNRQQQLKTVPLNTNTNFNNNNIDRISNSSQINNNNNNNDNDKNSSNITSSSSAGNNLIPSLVSGIITWGVDNLLQQQQQQFQKEILLKQQQAQCHQESSDDSEFEIVNTDELN